MSIKWNSNEIKTYFGIYEQYVGLWNVKQNEPVNKYVKDCEFESLMKDLRDEGLISIDTTKHQVQAKIKSLKDAFRQEVAKIAISLKSNSKYVYKPKLVWFENARFLEDVVYRKQNISNQIEEDTTNYVQYNIMKQQGEKVILRLKEGVVPHKYHCQKRNMPPPQEGMCAMKRQRLPLINESLTEFAKPPLDSHVPFEDYEEDSVNSDRFSSFTADNEQTDPLGENTTSQRVRSSPTKPSSFPAYMKPPPEHSSYKKFKRSQLLAEVGNVIRRLDANAGTEIDSIEHFGRYVASQIRSLPRREGVLLQQEIQASITQALIKTIPQDGTSNITPISVDVNAPSTST